MNMKKETGFKWKVGLMVVIGFVLLVGTVFFIGKQKNLFGSIIRLQANFSNVSGLKVGNNVRFGGIDIGTVDDIRLTSDTSVRVVMIIQSSLKKYIKNDASATIGSEGLMGDRVVVISPGDSSRTEIQENGILESSPPVEMDEIMSSLKASADNVAIISDQFASVAYKINNGKGVLAKLLGDSTFANNISSTVRNLKKGTQGLDENMEAVKHNFLLKGYFKKKQKKEDKKKKDQEETDQKQAQAKTPVVKQ
jgi:phospholipid/cholesterol/gamma-HCH transport system substrate-binding protein